MWKFMKNLFGRKKETKQVISSVNEQVISDAYKSVEPAIESLRKYDRGEKNIDAPDLRSALRNLR